MATADFSTAQWRKSTHTGDGNNGACVEVAFAADVIGVRDSKQRDGGNLVLGRSGWGALLESIR